MKTWVYLVVPWTGHNSLYLVLNLAPDMVLYNSTWKHFQKQFISYDTIPLPVTFALFTAARAAIHLLTSWVLCLPNNIKMEYQATVSISNHNNRRTKYPLLIWNVYKFFYYWSWTAPFFSYFFCNGRVLVNTTLLILPLFIVVYFKFTGENKLALLRFCKETGSYT